jgi:hypothetical protein
MYLSKGKFDLAKKYCQVSIVTFVTFKTPIVWGI